MRPHPIVKCSKPLAANASAAPLDVVKMKSALGALGHYDAPEWGVSQFPDVALFDAIKAFQKSQGLKADGAIKPDGETEAALSQAMTPRRATNALQATAQALQSMGRGGDELLAHITPEEAALLHTVTDGATINPHTGLLEFWFGFSGNDDKDTYEGSVTEAADDETLSDDSFWDGYESATTSYDAANSDGKDGFGGGDKGSKSNGDDGHGLGGSGDDDLGAKMTGSLVEKTKKEKEDQAKADADRRNRVAGQTVDDRGLLSTNAEDDEEDAQDWNSGLLGEDDPAPSQSPTVDPNAPPESKADPEPKAKGGTPTVQQYNEKLKTLSGWDRFVYGTKYGYLNNPKAKDKKNERLRSPNLRPSGFDKKLGRTIGLNDFRNGGVYGPYAGESKIGAIDYAERRARWQAGTAAVAGPVTTAATTTTKALGPDLSKKDKNTPGALTSITGVLLDQNPDEGVIQEVNTAVQNAEQENRQRMADIAKARQRTKLAAKELDRIRAAQSVQTAPSLTDTVGPNGKNKPADVKALQEALVRNAVMGPSAATGYFGTATEDATKALNLTEDGFVTPGGPTEAALLDDSVIYQSVSDALTAMGYDKRKQMLSLPHASQIEDYSMDEHGNWYDSQGRSVPSPYVNGNLQLASQQKLTLDLDIPAEHRAVFDQAERIGIPSGLIDPKNEFDQALVGSHQQLGMKTEAERKVAKHLEDQLDELAKTKPRYKAIRDAMKMAKAKSLSYAADAGSFGYMSDEQLAKFNSWYNPNSWAINPLGYSVKLQDEIYHRDYLKANDVEKMAMRRGVGLSKEAKDDPKAKMGLVRAKTYHYQTPLEKYKTMELINDLAEKYPEFRSGGVRGSIAVSIGQPKKELWSMSEQELKDTLEENKNALSVLKGASAGEFGKNLAKLGPGTLMSTALNLAGLTHRIEAANKKIEHMLAYPSD